MPQDSEQMLASIQDTGKKIENELSKVIIGQQETVEQLMIGLFSRGHCLLQGVPGLGKTLLVKSIAQLFDFSFKRIQFTPDLMPSDIYGTEFLEQEENGRHHLRFIHGPLFANILLADEINRTPPKTQAALLEAMEEKKVTVAGKNHPLPQPFFVLATQNPIESEGTYPLPEAQLDRFLLNINMDYLQLDDEIEMVSRTTGNKKQEIQSIISLEEMVALQKLVPQVPISSELLKAAVTLVASTRPDNKNAPGFIREYLRWGAGSRASQALILTAKSRALLQGRVHVAKEDLRALAPSVLRHRIIPGFNASAQGISTDDIIQRLIEESSL